MLQMIMYLSILIISISFLQLSHPLAMGLTLLVQTLLICLMTGMLTKTFWFSYILFLIFLGGMLILFIYVTSLASNEMFSLSMKLMMLSVMVFFIFNTLYIFLDKSLTISFLPNHEMMENIINSFTQENTLNLNKLYNFPSNMITLLLINYLLITLIAIVKITNIFYGPLRPMN